ncbi:MAG: hypothetical protein Q9224_007700, partial [Gallowayella concinna]
PLNELATVETESGSTVEIKPDTDVNERIIARVIEGDMVAQDEDKSTCDIAAFLDSLGEDDTHGPDIKAYSKWETSVGDDDDEYDEQPHDLPSETPSTTPSPSHNQLEPNTSDPSLINNTALSPPSTTSDITTPSPPHNTIPPTPSTTDTRNIGHSMRTATPRSGRGSVSRGKKMGQVSRVISSH